MPDPKEIKTGLFFGSFDPFHLGHLEISNRALTDFALREVWFIATPQNPVAKSNRPLDAFQRFEMIQKSIAGLRGLRACDVELKLQKPFLTISTLKILWERFPTLSFSLILGGDNLRSFARWREYETILKECELIVYPRRSDSQPENSSKHPGEPGAKWNHRIKWMKGPEIPISSSRVRDLVRSDKPYRNLVPGPVYQMIAANKWYR